ncbi:GntR family transcriptional regulator [Pseudoruegeria sp. SK021]|nr:GntR family transcriptional regulator [Pseudoruegeria sp. SK021]
MPVSATAVAESVADVIRERIIKGDLAAGARIVERKLSAELNVSRTPVREALKLLRADGLVEISRNCGAQVTGYTPAEARQLFDVIAVMESLAAERLAQRITPDELDQIEDLHAAMLAYYKVGNVEDYFDANSAIHDAIIDLCGNAALKDAHKRVMLRTRRGRYLAIMSPVRWKQAVAEHETLMDALRLRDASAAAAIWRQHLSHTGDTVAAVLSSDET